MKTLNNEDFVNIWAKLRGGKFGGEGGKPHFHSPGENVLLALLSVRENFVETKSFKGTVTPHGAAAAPQQG